MTDAIDVTQEMIEAGRKAVIGSDASGTAYEFGTVASDQDYAAIYRAMREKEPPGAFDVEMHKFACAVAAIEPQAVGLNPSSDQQSPAQSDERD